MNKKALPLLIFIILFASLSVLSCQGSPEQAPDDTNGVSISDDNRTPPEANGAPEEAENEAPEETGPPFIGLYSGRGSWDVNVEALERFLSEHNYEWSLFDDEDALNQGYLKEFDLIWFPGGFAAEYKNLISDHGPIRSFVEDGGAFVGSCAGAYYAADILRWLGTDHEYPLKLFDGKAAGPLAGLIGRGETASFTLESAHPANDGFESPLVLYYFDGPYFIPYDSGGSITVLARYEINGEPAVIAGRYGSGKYLLFGPHPELGGYSPDFPDFNLDGGEGAQWPWLHSVLTWFAAWE